VRTLGCSTPFLGDQLPREFPVFARYILPVLLSFAVKQLRKRNVRGASMPTSRARSRSRFRF
jgi:hypothetical protein